MKLLVDMNLSPKWCSVLQTEGWDTVHWSDVGAASAPDQEVMQWALSNDHVVVTHDLDFGAPSSARNRA
jgi:predicted nuclease of predicted toxin-antitoxin system